jgi:aldehyde dehydrogenase (NAD+)
VIAADSLVDGAIAAASEAQAAWAATPVAERLRPITALRRSIASDPIGWAESVVTPYDRTRAESLAAECLPTADACVWLAKRAAKVLKPRRSGGWWKGVSLRVERKPLGVVLVIGAGNYPLFLLAIPAIQALAAGNAVLLKPSPAAGGLAAKLRDTLVAGGLDPRLVVVLDDTAQAAQQAIAAGVDHVVATGSSATGRAVARAAAERLTPCVLECSGSDAVVVLPGADAQRVAACVAWGLGLNGGATCIGPRRLIVVGVTNNGVTDRVIDRLQANQTWEVPAPVAEAVRRVMAAELDGGAVVRAPAGFDRAQLHAACDARRLPAMAFLSNSNPSAVSQSDLFAPVLSLDFARDENEAVRLANASPFALGASVFGPREAAERVARRLRAGCVTVNDVIAPTADADVPFGGAGESGYGVTRGAEGLLAMTRPQAIVTRRGSWLPHLDKPTPELDEIAAGLIQSRHAAGVGARLAGVKRLVRAAMLRKEKVTAKYAEDAERNQD